MKIYTKEQCFQNGFGLHLRRHRIHTAELSHTHEFVELVYILDGEGIHGIDGVEYAVRRGCLLLINYRQNHYFRTDSEMEFYNILLDPEWVSEKLIEQENAFALLSLSGFGEFAQVDTGQPLLSFRGDARLRLERLIGDMFAEQENREPGFEAALKAQTNLLLCLIFRQMIGSPQLPGGLGPEFLQYLREHCAEKLSLEELSKSCFYNPSYLSRRFKEYFGITITDFLSRSRLEKAEELLRSSNLSTDRIAQECGFSSKNAFYRQFKEFRGMTPGDFRRQVKN